MATVEPRGRTKQGDRRWRVKWREGGRREDPWAGVTFDELARAKKFKGLVDANGNCWPSDEELRRHGFTELIFALESTIASDPESEAEPAVLFKPYALTHVKQRINANAESKRLYERRLELHVFPTFGERPVSELYRRSEWRKWQTKLLEEKGLSPKTIANIRGEAVVPILDAACLPGDDNEPALLEYNPLRGLDLPERHPVEREILETPKEAKLFTKLAYEVDREAADLLVTKIAGGFRWSEVAGIPVRAVHRDRNVVSIRQVLVRVENHWIIRLVPKSPAGWREIPLPEQVMAMLAQRCEDKRRNDLVFTTPLGKPWQYSYFHRTRWTPIRDAFEEKTDKYLQPHGLRHSMLTLLGSSGIDLQTLRQVAGHEHISTTFKYYVHSTRKHYGEVRAATSDFVALPAGKEKTARKTNKASVSTRKRPSSTTTEQTTAIPEPVGEIPSKPAYGPLFLAPDQRPSDHD